MCLILYSFKTKHFLKSYLLSTIPDSEDSIVEKESRKKISPLIEVTVKKKKILPASWVY